MTTLEQVEKLCVMANLSYEEAKGALEAANGDLLEAVILLEKQGKIQAPAGSGYYSSEKTTGAAGASHQENDWQKHNHANHDYHHYHKENGFISFLKKSSDFCFRMLRKGNRNSFEVLKGQEVKASLPVTALALLLIFAFWVTIPLIIIGLFFSFRYRFVGPDFNGNSVNSAMHSASEAAENLKKSINL
ncbi:MAG: ubiquitin [Thermincola sp.]|jgi:hypothetical protein|nr:ubiquitin [Thermincola sp.]MDT3702412.1 ubiquitin [Thermincola sp.]